MPKARRKAGRPPVSKAPLEIMPDGCGRYGKHRKWSIKVKTFGTEPEEDTSYDLNARRERRSLEYSKMAPEQHANAFRGAIVAVMQAHEMGWDAEHRFMLIRLQELYAELMARNPNAGKFTVTYDQSDPA